MNVVMTMGRAKDTYIQVRVGEGLKDDVQTTAKARGLTMSGLIHSLMTQAVREERERYPHLFNKMGKGVPATTIKMTGADKKRETG